MRWSFATDAPLVGLQFGRESGETLAADESGGLYLLDRQGQITALTRGFHGVLSIAWSDSGNGGAVLLEDRKVCRLTPRLTVDWSRELPDSPLAVAVDPFGNNIAVSMADAATIVLDWKKNLTCEFSTIRPLKFLRFVSTDRKLIGAAEYGLLCCHDFSGNELWNEKIWTNIGDLSITGKADTVLMAGFNHGIQVFDADGGQCGAYMVEGAPNRVSTTFTRERVAATTIEHYLYWMDSDGELLWATEADEDFVGLHSDPLGNGLVCGLRSGRICRLTFDEAQ